MTASAGPDVAADCAVVAWNAGDPVPAAAEDADICALTLVLKIKKPPNPAALPYALIRALITRVNDTTAKKAFISCVFRRLEGNAIPVSAIPHTKDELSTATNRIVAAPPRLPVNTPAF